MDKKDFNAYGRSAAHTSKLHFFADDTPFSSVNFFGKQKRGEVVSSSCAAVALQCRVVFLFKETLTINLFSGLGMRTCCSII